MRITTSLTALALALSAAPLSAQIVVRPDPSDRRPTSNGGIGDIIFGDARVDTTAASRRGANRVPPGHLPPRGMCRVWIDGVPPGQQPAVTSCAQAEQDRLRYGANARVIYGDRESFRGRANGKFDKRGQRDARDRQCQMRDGVVVDGRVVNVCSDERVRQARRDRDDDDDDDDDRLENRRGKSGKNLAKASRGKSGKHGRG